MPTDPRTATQHLYEQLLALEERIKELEEERDELRDFLMGLWFKAHFERHGNVIVRRDSDG